MRLIPSDDRVGNPKVDLPVPPLVFFRHGVQLPSARRIVKLCYGTSVTIKPIRNDADNEAALARIKVLWEAEPGTPEGDELEVLGALVEDYERRRYPITEDELKELEAVPDPNEKRRLYSGDGNGKWYLREWKPRCTEDAYLLGLSKCCGTQGHKGPHWAYGEEGSYHWNRNDSDPDSWEKNTAAGSTPPGHPTWVSPVDKASDYYMDFFEDSEVTDPEVIRLIESGEIRDAVTSPCTEEEIEELRRLGRLDGLDDL